MPRSKNSSPKIGLIIPSAMERQFLDTGDLDNVMVEVSGMGKLRAAFGAHKLIDGGCKAILLSGYAGGLHKTKPGDIVCPSAIWEGDYRTPFEDYPLMVRPSILSTNDQCVMISQDAFIKSNIYKSEPEYKFLEGGNIPVATDMESYAVAWTAIQKMIPVYIVKMVSDVVGEKSEKDFLDSCSYMSPKLSSEIKKAILKIREELK